MEGYTFVEETTVTTKRTITLKKNSETSYKQAQAIEFPTENMLNEADDLKVKMVGKMERLGTMVCECTETDNEKNEIEKFTQEVKKKEKEISKFRHSIQKLRKDINEENQQTRDELKKEVDKVNGQLKSICDALKSMNLAIDKLLIATETKKTNTEKPNWNSSTSIKITTKNKSNNI